MSKLNIKNMIYRLGIMITSIVVLSTSLPVIAHAKEDDTYRMHLEIDGIIDSPYKIKNYRKNGNSVQFIMPMDTGISRKIRQAEMNGEKISGTMKITTNASIDWEYYLYFNEVRIVSTYMEYEERTSGAVDIYDIITVEGDISDRYVVRSTDNEVKLSEAVPENEQPLIHEDIPEYDDPVVYDDEMEYEEIECDDTECDEYETEYEEDETEYDGTEYDETDIDESEYDGQAMDYDD